MTGTTRIHLDGQIINESTARPFPACKPDFEVQRAQARRYLYGDVPAFRRVHLTEQIDERMRQLTVAGISRELLDQTIDRLETTLATLIDERNRLDRISAEAGDALD